MIIIKFILLICIFITSLLMGNLISNKYINRVNDLKELKNALNMFKTKIRFTYEPIPEIFSKLADLLKPNIGEIFKKSSIEMENNIIAGEAWIEALKSSNTNLLEEDKKIIQGLSRLLGQTDLEGQLSEIELTSSFLDTQIEKAEIDKNKNVKLCKTLSLVLGITTIIILI